MLPLLCAVMAVGPNLPLNWKKTLNIEKLLPDRLKRRMRFLPVSQT